VTHSIKLAAVVALIGPAVWLAPSRVEGADPEAVLQNIVQQALASSPAIEAGRAAVEGAERRAAAADRLPDPELGIGYSPVAIETRGGPQRARLTLTQGIPFFGKRGLWREEAEADARAWAARSRGTAAEVRRAVQERFWEIYRIDRAIEIAEEEKLLLEDVLQAAEAKYATGGGSQANLFQTQLLQTRISNRLLLLQGERAAAVEHLAGLVGGRVDPPALDEMHRPLVRIDSAEVMASVLAGNPDLRASEEKVTRSRFALDAMRREYYPDFALSLGWQEIGESDLPGEWNGRDAWSVGAMVTLPLGRGGIEERVEARRHALVEAEAQREDRERRLAARAGDLLRRIAAAGESMALYRDGLVPQARSTFESAMAAYATGGLEFADLVLAERSLLEVRLGYHETVAGYRNLVAGLEGLLGVVTPECRFPPEE